MRSWRRHPFLGSARRGRESGADGRERDTFARKGSWETAGGTLGRLRALHPARGGEVLEVLPAARPRNAPKPSWTVSLVRRATPFFAIAAVYAIQVSAGAGPVLAFPLYLTVILLTALQLSRVESLATAFVAAIAVLVPSVVGGDLAQALLLAIGLLVAAFAITEVVRQVRATADRAQRQSEEIAASEERLRLMLEAAMVGLALVDGEGRCIQVNERLGTILGRPQAALLQLPLEAVTAERDRAVLNEALALLRSGVVARWAHELRSQWGWSAAPGSGASSRRSKPCRRAAAMPTSTSRVWSASSR